MPFNIRVSSRALPAHKKKKEKFAYEKNALPFSGNKIL